MDIYNGYFHTIKPNKNIKHRFNSSYIVSFGKSLDVSLNAETNITSGKINDNKPLMNLMIDPDRFHKIIRGIDYIATTSK